MMRHLLLDLDNTLYPASGGMDAGITRRMMEFVSDFLGVPFEEGARRRSSRLGAYGTTLEWLKAEYNLTDEAAYFEAVHPESELAELTPDPELRNYLLSLGLPMTLLTNAPMAHAQRLLRFFNIEDIFIGVFDLTFHKGVGKPHPDCFFSTLKAVGFTVEESLFIDDHPKYVRGYQAIGGRAVIVDEDGRFEKMAKDEGFGHIRTIYGLASILDTYR